MSNLEEALADATSLVVDFSATSEDFENLPEGPYTTVITKAGPGTSAAGNTVLKVTYKVTDGPEAGRYAFSSLNVDGKAAWKIRKALKAFGVVVAGQRLDLDPADLIDRKVIIHVDAEGWVDDWTKVSGSGLE